MIRPGILALQGGFAAHKAVVEKLGYSVILVKTPQDLSEIDCLVLPGGESTVMERLLKRFGLWDVLREMIRNGFPLFGTCAGMILLSAKISESKQPTLSAMDFTVRRNAYGRQDESFEAGLTWNDESFTALFIRAPRIISTGKSVQVLLSYDGSPVLVRQNSFLAASFHPELTGFSGIHKYFLEKMSPG